MDNRPLLPNRDQMSVMTATILLIYALSRFIVIPPKSIALQLLGIFIDVPIDIRLLIIPFVTAIAATGSVWIFRSHPKISNQQLAEHWILPSLSAMVIGFPILVLPIGPSWWSSFFLGGLIFTAVVIAEYLTIGKTDFLFSWASAVLISVSFMIYLVILIVLHFVYVRLIYALPIALITTMLISLRTMKLRIRSHWALIESFVLSIIAIQLVTFLHYTPISPFSFGLIILGFIYSGIALITQLYNTSRSKMYIIESGVILVLSWTAAFWFK